MGDGRQRRHMDIQEHDDHNNRQFNREEREDHIHVSAWISSSHACFGLGFGRSGIPCGTDDHPLRLEQRDHGHPAGHRDEGLVQRHPGLAARLRLPHPEQRAEHRPLLSVFARRAEPNIRRQAIRLRADRQSGDVLHGKFPGAALGRCSDPRDCHLLHDVHLAAWGHVREAVERRHLRQWREDRRDRLRLRSISAGPSDFTGIAFRHARRDQSRAVDDRESRQRDYGHVANASAARVRPPRIPTTRRGSSLR